MSVSPRDVARLREAAEQETARRRAESEAAAEEEAFEGYGEWWDDEHALVAGVTSGGAAYGIRWEELSDEERGGVGDVKAPPDEQPEGSWKISPR